MVVIRLLLSCCLILGATLPVVAQDVRLEGSDDRAEMLQMFDGKSLDGWRGEETVWSARDGEVVGRSEKPLTVPAQLTTERAFGDFRLLAEVRLDAGAEFAIVWGAACIAAPGSTPSDCQARLVTLTADVLKTPDLEWAQLELIVVGQRTRLAINGREMPELLAPASSPIERGPIALRLGASEQPPLVRLRRLLIETHPGLTFQTVQGDLPPTVAMRSLERTVDPRDETIERWTKLTEALVPDELLQPVRGTHLPLTSMGVRDVERDAYYALVQKARELPLTTLHRAASDWRDARRALPEHRRYARLPVDKFPMFADLFRNPLPYHGKLVTLRGHVRQLDEMPADDNPYGIKQLYQVWLFDEHAQSNPTVVVCTSLDPRLKPEPETLLNYCQVTGYFFKNMAYDGQRDLRFAPLLIAQKLEYFPPNGAAPGMIDSAIAGLVRATGLSRGALAVVGLLAMCGLSLFVVVRMRRRPNRTQAAAAAAATTTTIPQFDNLADNGGRVDFSRLEQNPKADETKPPPE